MWKSRLQELNHCFFGDYFLFRFCFCSCCFCTSAFAFAAFPSFSVLVVVLVVAVVAAVVVFVLVVLPQQILHITAEENTKQPPSKFYFQGIPVLQQQQQELVVPCLHSSFYWVLTYFSQELLGATVGSLSTVLDGCSFGCCFCCCQGGAWCHGWVFGSCKGGCSFGPSKRGSWCGATVGSWRAVL